MHNGFLQKLDLTRIANAPDYQPALQMLQDHRVRQQNGTVLGALTMEQDSQEVIKKLETFCINVSSVLVTQSPYTEQKAKKIESVTKEKFDNIKTIHKDFGFVDVDGAIIMLDEIGTAIEELRGLNDIAKKYSVTDSTSYQDIDHLKTLDMQKSGLQQDIGINRFQTQQKLEKNQTELTSVIQQIREIRLRTLNGKAAVFQEYLSKLQEQNTTLARTFCGLGGILNKGAIARNTLAIGNLEKSIEAIKYPDQAEATREKKASAYKGKYAKIENLKNVGI